MLLLCRCIGLNLEISLFLNDHVIEFMLLLCFSILLRFKKGIEFFVRKI